MAARPQTPPVVPPPQPAPEGSPTGQIAGLAAGELLPLTAIGVAAPAVPAVGGKLTEEGAKALAAILAAFLRFEDSRKVKAAARLRTTITTAFPERTAAEVDRLVQLELSLDAEFQRRQNARLERDLPAAIAISDPAKRKARIEAILARERRYVQQREQMMLDRAAARAEFMTVKAQSPLGAFWKLSPHVREHTPACVALGNKFWPWQVLDKIHPRIHGGCACTLLSLDDAVRQGLMRETQVPDVKDAIRRAQDIATTYDEMHHYVSEWEALAHIERVWSEPFLVGLREAGYALRYAAGTEHGGEFRPKTGGDPGSLTHRLLRRLVPHRPLTPVEQERVRLGQWREVAGRRVFVPEYREWRRTLGGRKLRSPAGSTHVYDDGPKASLSAERPEELGALADERTEAAQAVAARALEHPQSQVVSPAEAGAKQSHSGMLAAGFRMTGRKLDPVSGALTNHYVHPESGARASVRQSPAGEVEQVEWSPGLPPPPVKPLIEGRVPYGFREFAEDVHSEMAGIAEREGAGLHLGPMLTDPRLQDHNGTHDWSGRVDLGRDIEPTIQMLAQASGRDLDAVESREVFASIKTAVHEGLHGVNPIGERDFLRPSNRALEEGLTEEIANDVTVSVLRRYGRDDVLRWVRSNPTDWKVDGSYSIYRDALAQVFADAGVEPEQNRALVHALKFSVRPEDRVKALGGLIADRTGADPDVASVRVDEVLGLAHYRYSELGDAAENVVLAPLTRPDLDGVPTIAPVQHLGVPVLPGVMVQVRLPDGSLRFSQVVEVSPRGGSFVALVRDAYSGETRRVSPDAIVGVGTARGEELSIGGQAVVPGVSVSYSRADGGRSVATVVRVTRSRNTDMDVPGDGWQVEARTPDDASLSTNPDEPVVLTARNAPGIRVEESEPAASAAPGDLIRGAKARGGGRKGLKFPAKGWKEEVERLRETPLIGQDALRERKLEAGRAGMWKAHEGADGKLEYRKGDWRIVYGEHDGDFGADVYVGDEHKGWVSDVHGEDAEGVFRKAAPDEQDPANEFSDTYYGAPGRPGKYETMGSHPGTEFEDQHGRVMEAGARLDAEVARRLKPAVVAAKAAERELKEFQERMHALDDRISEMRYEETRKQLVVDGWEELTNDQIFERRKAWMIASLGGGEGEVTTAVNQPVVDAWNRAENLSDVIALKDEVHAMRFDLPGKNSGLTVLLDAKAKADLAVGSARRAHAFDVLNEIRPFGGLIDAEADLDTRDLLREVETYLPRDWIVSSNEHDSELLVQWSEERGFYRERVVSPSEPYVKKSMVKVSASPEAPGMSRGSGTLLHEMVHRAEHTHDGVKAAEWTFYHARTAPYRNARLEPLVSLREKTKIAAYAPNEVAREDEFVDLYAGKDYGSEMVSNYELLSLGVEDLATGRLGMLQKDEEYRQWVLGMLALA